MHHREIFKRGEVKSMRGIAGHIGIGIGQVKNLNQTLGVLIDDSTNLFLQPASGNL